MKMNKISIYLSLVAIIAALITSSCRDEFNQEQALANQTASDSSAQVLSSDLEKRNQEDLELLRDSLARIGGKVNFTLQLIDGSVGFPATDNTREKNGLAGATVTMSQNGAAITATDIGNGLYTAPDLRVGEVAVNVQATGYTTVNFIAEVLYQQDQNYGNTFAPTGASYEREVAAQMAIFNESGATVNGVVSGQTNLTNSTKELLPGVTVRSKITNIDSRFFTATSGNILVRNVVYNNTNSTTTDDNGAYTLSIPAATNPGLIEVELYVSDVVANQTLLDIQNDLPVLVSDARAIWSESQTSADISDIPSLGVVDFTSEVATVTPVYVTIDAPVSGSGATATATLVDPDPAVSGDETITIDLSAGGANYRTTGAIELLIQGGGANTRIVGINFSSGNVDIISGNGQLKNSGDPANAPVYPFTIATGEFLGEYTSAPTVTIIDTDVKERAVFYCAVSSDGEIVDIWDEDGDALLDGDNDLTTADGNYESGRGFRDGAAITLNIVDVLGTGTGLNIALPPGNLSGGRIVDLLLISGGSGYVTGNTPAVKEAPGDNGINTLVGGPVNGFTYIDEIYLGTGFRPGDLTN